MTQEVTQPVVPAPVHGRPLRAKLKDIKLGPNCRDVELDAEFVASVRRKGVKDAITVWLDEEDGMWVVHKGFHRYVAAVETKQVDVPVAVTDRPASNAARLIDQYEENERRRGFTVAQKIAIFEQLELEGLSEGQIAKELSEDRKAVKAALTITRTTKARAAVEQADLATTIEQALALAEFDGDDDAVESIVTAISDGQFEHRLQELRDARTRQEAKAELLAKLGADGLKVTRSPVWDDSTVAALGDLRDLAGKTLTVAQHASCPGHAVYLVESHRADTKAKMFRSEFACTDYRAHKHYKRDEKLRAADMTTKQRQAAKGGRDDTIASNRAWTSAQKVRREWLATFAKRKTAPSTAARFIAQSHALAHHQLKRAISNGNRLGLDLLGVEQRNGHDNPRGRLLAETVTAGTEARAQMTTLVLVLAAYEQVLPANAWRGGDGDVARYLTFLAANGYRLSDVETRACAAVAQDGDTSEDSTPTAAPADTDEDQAGHAGEETGQ